MARWSVLGPEDLLFLANVKHDLRRYDEAISYLKQLVAVRPDLDKFDRALFGMICKDAVDTVRSELKIIGLAIAEQQKEGQIPRVDKLVLFRDRGRERLRNLCNEVLDIAKNHLLPNAIDYTSQVFVQKMIGDFYRYLSEHGISEDAKGQAEQAYTTGIEIAEKNSMTVFDPVRLGLILNVAVLAHQHNGDAQKAIQLVQKALEQVRKCPTKMTPEESNEVLAVIEAMHDNLRNWDVSDDESGDEENARL
jgi:tetratricopeptide (TPR) repeat protein